MEPSYAYSSPCQAATKAATIGDHTPHFIPRARAPSPRWFSAHFFFQQKEPFLFASSGNRSLTTDYPFQATTDNCIIGTLRGGGVLWGGSEGAFFGLQLLVEEDACRAKKHKNKKRKICTP